MPENKVNYEQKIKTIRKKLEESGLENGFTHEKTVHISKKLDTIITQCIKEQVKMDKWEK